MIPNLRFHVLLLAALLASSGLALLTSAPPALEVAIWPPTGIGLVAVLVYRRKALPAIITAEFVILLTYSYQYSSTYGFGVRAAVAVLFGLVYAGQAVFGAWLIRRFIGYPCPLTRGRDVFLFLALVGPIHTLPQCLFSSAAACAMEIRPWGEYAVVLGEWWWSESVGGAVFGPITLCLVGLPATVWRPRRLTVALPLFVFTAATAGLLVLAHSWEEQAVRRQIESSTTEAASDVRDDFDRVIQSMNRVRFLIPIRFDLQRPIVNAQFQTIVGDFRRFHPFVTRIQIATYVPVGNVETFERTAGVTSPEIRENGIWQRGDDGRPVRARGRDWYAPVTYSHPVAEAPWPVGFDVASENSVRSAWQAVTATPRPTLFRIDSPHPHPGWVLFVPIEGADPSSNAPSPLQACLILQIDPVRLAARVNEPGRSNGMTYYLVPQGERETRSAHSVAVPVQLAGSEFHLHGWASNEFVHRDRKPYTFGVAVIGVGYAILLSSLLLIVTGRSAEVSDAVTARTADLRAEIASRAEVEENLRSSEARLAEAQRIAHLAAWEWDAEPDAVTWTDELTNLLGPPPGPNPALENLLEFVNPEDRPSVEAVLSGAADGNRAGEQEVRARTSAGQERYVVFKAVPVPGRFPGRRVRGTVQDVTDRRRFEDQLRDTQRLESLGVLAGGVAHDFNNLLTGILGHASLIREQLPPDSAHHKSLRVIEQASDHAAALCQQMLAYAGRGPSHRELVDVNRFIKDTVDLLKVSVHKKIDLRFDLADGVQPVRADASQLRQVLMNFVTNASEAVTGPAGRITVRTGFGPPPCSTVGPFHRCDQLPTEPFAWFEVEDTGCGMTPEVMGRVFEPFFTTKFTGRGLGLSAVHGIVRGHGGEVCMTSTPGLGTTVRVYLPGVEAPEYLVRTPAPSAGLTEVQPMPAPRTPAPKGGGAAAPVVLVADDEPSVRAFAATALRTAGYTTLEEVDGFEAIHRLETDPAVKVLLLDVTMPGMNGRDTLDRIAHLRPDVAVVLMSGYTEHEVQNLFGSPTVHGFVSKPFRPADLTQAVGRAAVRVSREPSAV